jgi:hypothetical protein
MSLTSRHSRRPSRTLFTAGLSLLLGVATPRLVSAQVPSWVEPEPEPATPDVRVLLVPEGAAGSFASSILRQLCSLIGAVPAARSPYASIAFVERVDEGLGPVVLERLAQPNASDDDVTALFTRISDLRGREQQTCGSGPAPPARSVHTRDLVLFVGSRGEQSGSNIVLSINRFLVHSASREIVREGQAPPVLLPLRSQDLTEIFDSDFTNAARFLGLEFLDFRRRTSAFELIVPEEESCQLQAADEPTATPCVPLGAARFELEQKPSPWIDAEITGDLGLRLRPLDGERSVAWIYRVPRERRSRALPINVRLILPREGRFEVDVALNPARPIWLENQGRIDVKQQPIIVFRSTPGLAPKRHRPSVLQALGQTLNPFYRLGEQDERRAVFRPRWRTLHVFEKNLLPFVAEDTNGAATDERLRDLRLLPAASVRELAQTFTEQIKAIRFPRSEHTSALEGARDHWLNMQGGTIARELLPAIEVGNDVDDDLPIAPRVCELLRAELLAVPAGLEADGEFLRFWYESCVSRALDLASQAAAQVLPLARLRMEASGLSVQAVDKLRDGGPDSAVLLGAADPIVSRRLDVSTPRAHSVSAQAVDAEGRLSERMPLKLQTDFRTPDLTIGPFAETQYRAHEGSTTSGGGVSVSVPFVEGIFFAAGEINGFGTVSGPLRGRANARLSASFDYLCFVARSLALRSDETVPTRGDSCLPLRGGASVGWDLAGSGLLGGFVDANLPLGSRLVLRVGGRIGLAKGGGERGLRISLDWAAR